MDNKNDKKKELGCDESESPISLIQVGSINDEMERLGTSSSEKPKNLTEECTRVVETVQDLLLENDAWKKELESATTNMKCNSESSTAKAYPEIKNANDYFKRLNGL